MKKKYLILLFTLHAINCFSQTKCFKQFNGEILNNTEYKQLKKQKIENFKRTSDNLTLIDETKEIRRNKDSIIYEIILYGVPISMAKELKARKKLIGKKFQFDNLITIDGKKLNLSDLNGKPTLVNFWSTQCTPRLEEIPVLNLIKEEFKDKINFISITYDPKEKVAKLLEKINYDFIHITDSKAVLAKFVIESYPQNYLINKNGYIYSIENGIPNVIQKDGTRKIGDGKEIKEKLKKLLFE